MPAGGKRKTEATPIPNRSNEPYHQCEIEMIVRFWAMRKGKLTTDDKRNLAECLGRGSWKTIDYVVRGLGDGKPVGHNEGRKNANRIHRQFEEAKTRLIVEGVLNAPSQSDMFGRDTVKEEEEEQLSLPTLR